MIVYTGSYAIAATGDLGSNTKPGLVFRDLGRMGWAEAEAVQQQNVAKVQSGEPDTLLFVEHEPVVTLGRNADLSHLRLSPEKLEQQGVALHRASRGGDVTCHFPGQLVVYAICDLKRRQGGIKAFVALLEQAAQLAAQDLSISAERDPERRGLWVRGRKLVSVGLAVSRQVTSHGLALNVGRDLNVFSLVTPCGLAGVEPTSLNLEREKQGLASVTMEHAKHVCKQRFFEALAPA
ncbi:MAG: lipoyl(octanoyl) transferase [Desulfovibrio sp.]|nr:MAG: lipoyl(octanoyl) transferase [Desulfovibrio sp.]